MVWESLAVPNLAGREHLVAVSAAILLGLLRGRRLRLPYAGQPRPRPVPPPAAPAHASGAEPPHPARTSGRPGADTSM
ncbi:hypothetical protein ACIPWL_21510 [Streptomyces sp. NPDC090023]|uniref:hypothetical protein n=1 Tax=unclassified Streptomyces TaxID=2593676 RepID=UPI00382C2F59